MATAESVSQSTADRRFYAVGGVVTLVILAFLAWLLYLRVPTPGGSVDVSFLPAVNATLNALASVFLVSGFIAIRTQKRELHIALMVAALSTSALFLVSYVTYHAFHGDTKYPADAPLRVLYLSVLASHVLLSMVLPFLALTVLWFAYRGQFNRHRRIARVTLPLWLYVSVTGVLIFFMLRAATG